MIRIALLVGCVAVYSVQGHFIQDVPQEVSPGFAKDQELVPDIPHYKDAYDNVSDYITSYKLHLYPAEENRASPPEDTSSLKLILAVIDGVISELARRPENGSKGLASYEDHYDNNARALLEAAQQNPEQVEERLKCIPEDIAQSIKPLQNVIYHDGLRHMCSHGTSACKQAIASQVEVSGLSHTGELVLALNDYVSLLTEKYWEPLTQLEDASDTELQSFVENSREFLKPLILSAARVRVLLGGDRCATYKINI